MVKLNLGLTRAEKKAQRLKEQREEQRIWECKASRWHLHFAILPIYLGKGDWRWLEFVERKLNHTKVDWFSDIYPVWDYRAARKK